MISFHPLGIDIPKCLFKVANKPILAYQLEFLERNKINEVNIVTNKKYHQQISDYLNDQYNGYAIISYIIFNFQLRIGGRLR